MRIAIIGNGKMGKAIAELAGERGHVIHTVISRVENSGGRALTRERLSGADVAVEFTRPDAAAGNLERLIELGIPTVTGTTGWAEELPRLTSLVEQRGMRRAEERKPQSLPDDLVVVRDQHGDLAVFRHGMGFYECGGTPSPAHTARASCSGSGSASIVGRRGCHEARARSRTARLTGSISDVGRYDRPA